jgi:glycosyltransferase involved in cell wall biosynthesis
VPLIKKILILDTGKEWGGGTNSLLELLKRIDKVKYHITALFYNNYAKGSESDIKTEIEKLGIPFLVLKYPEQRFPVKLIKECIRFIFSPNKKFKKLSLFLLDYRVRIKKIAQEIAAISNNLDIDMIYLNNNPSSNLEGVIAAETTGRLALQHCRKAASLTLFEVKAANRALRKIICVSEGIKDELVKQGINASKCITVYNGIDLKMTPQGCSEEIRKKWNVADTDLLIGTVGSLLRLKRIEDLIEAFHILTKKTGGKVKCVIVGDGPEKDRLLQLVKTKKLYDKVIFTGFQSDAISYINALDIFVMTSEKEGLPRVILEAMLIGKPVVASNVTGPSELVVDRETGFLVPAGKPDMFADAILRLIESSEMRKQMGDNARKRVINNFSVERYVTRVEQVFAEVLG